MEVFRRYRSRRKSKGQTDVFTSFTDAESTYRPESSHRSGSIIRSSTATTRPGEVGEDRHIARTEFRQVVSSFEQPPTSSRGRPQPLLVSLSKPIPGSRPGTAESMQRALDKAAESVKYQQSSRSVAPSGATTGQHAPRYIDIFAISEQTQKSSRIYNEDVAKRNLDISSLAVKEQHYRYEPASKFQEEVASRNASSIAAPRTSSMRQIQEGEPSAIPEERSWSAQSNAYAHHPSSADRGRSRRLNDTGTHSSHHSTSYTRERRDQLPVIPQERSSEDFGLAASEAAMPKLQQDLGILLPRQAAASPQNFDVHRPDVYKVLPASPGRHEYLRNSMLSSSTDSTRRVSGFPDLPVMRTSIGGSVTGSNSTTDRRTRALQATVLPVSTTLNQGISRDQESRADHMSSSSYHLESIRAQSTIGSAPAYKRMLIGNRTIMDLTGDEDPDVVSLASYMPTPVIESARADSFQKLIPTMVDHSPKILIDGGDPVVPNTRWSSALEPMLDLDQLARRSQAISYTARTVNTVPIATQNTIDEFLTPRTRPGPALSFSPISVWSATIPTKVITFSPINTLTSTSPRTSEEISPELRGRSVNTRDVTATQMPMPQTQTEMPSKSVHGARLSANIAPLVRVFAEVTPEAFSEVSKSDRIPDTSRLTPGQTTIPKDGDVSSKKRGKMREKFEKAEEIRVAAKSKIPAGPLDQEPLPGVKTRDFAVTPVEKPGNRRVEALAERKKSNTELRSSKDRSNSSKGSSSERKSRTGQSRSSSKAVTGEEKPALPPPPPAHVEKKAEKKTEKKASRKSSRTGSNSSRKVRPKSVFDETAFQKKHAEANAALVRLQHSLQEPFDDTISQPGTSVGTLTPIGRSLSPIESRAPPQPSPSMAAMAMIVAATSSPGENTRPDLQADKVSTEGIPKLIRPQSRNTQQGTPASIHTVTLGLPRQTLTSHHTLARIDRSGKPPPSPGEVSLSAFPIPTPRALSPENARGPPAYVKDVGMPVRRDSQGSRLSSSSAFFIPFTMVPNRLGSLLENRVGVAGPSNSAQHHLDSIDAMMPSARNIMN